MMTGTNPIEQGELMAAVWYGGHIIPVNIVDRFESGGIVLAVIRANLGRPFVDGAKIPVRTDHLTVKLSDIFEIEYKGA